MLRLALRVRRADSELVLAELLELAPDGMEEVDVDPETVEYALYGAAGQLPSPGEVRVAAGAALLSLSSTEVADDWSERWREFHRPLILGDRLSVRPPWEPPQATDLDLVIDPGRAFGTGAHPTTRLCLELLLDVPRPRGGGAGGQRATGPGETLVVDLGCGSGVLAIAAARLGWPKVIALDHDPLCVEATLENAARNGVVLGEVGLLDLRERVVPQARLVLANLLSPLLLTWAGRMARGEDPGRPDQIIASGLLADEAGQVLDAFSELGYEQLVRSLHGDWAALSLRQRERG